MIYKIENANMTEASVNGARTICWSFDGKYILVQAETEPTTVLETYTDDLKGMLMSQPLWSQPCPGCKV